MKRQCLIHVVSPITCFNVPIVRDCQLNLTTEEIYKCLCNNAEITEILPNGKTLKLNFDNYNKQVEEKKPEEINPVEVKNEEKVVELPKDEPKVKLEDEIKEEVLENEVKEDTVEKQDSIEQTKELPKNNVEKHYNNTKNNKKR